MPNTHAETRYDQSVAIVRSAIPRMSELKIPITPSNYAVWFVYLTKSNPDLRQEMETLLGREKPITNDEMQNLYEPYLEERSAKVQVARHALSKLVQVLMSHISEADGHHSTFSSELKDVAEALSDEVSGDNLNALIDRAVHATNAALVHGAALKQQFTQLAVEMQELRGELARTQEEARTDTLTGMNNRLAFEEEMSKMHAHASEDSHRPCLILVDIDFFKGVNDNYGHLAGDFVLQYVAQQIKGSVRGRDVVARHGGEEFAILLRDTPRSGCLAVAENVRLHVYQSTVVLPPDMGLDQAVNVTVSVGGAWYREGETIQALVDRADRALYRSKGQGRNQVNWEG